MKKITFYQFALLMIIVLLVGCNGDVNSGSNNTIDSTNNNDVEEEVLTFGHAISSNPETSHYQQFADKFKEELESKTEGKLTLEIHPNEELGNEREMAEDVQTGSLDIIITAVGPLGNFSDLSNVLNMPFLFDGYDHVHRVLDGEIGEEINEDLLNNNFKVLAWADGGFSIIGNNKNQIKSVEDLKGLKIRTLENVIEEDTFKFFGANPTQMAGDELYTGLEQGTIDGIYKPRLSLVTDGFDEVLEYLTIANHNFLTVPVVMNSDKFNSYPEDIQNKIIEAAEAARDHEREFIQEKDEEAIEILEDKGVDIIKYGEIDIESFKSKAEDLYEQYNQYEDIINKIQEAR